MTIQSYLDTINLRYKTGTYRGDLQPLLMPRLMAQFSPDYSH